MGQLPSLLLEYIDVLEEGVRLLGQILLMKVVELKTIEDSHEAGDAIEDAADEVEDAVDK